MPPTNGDYILCSDQHSAAYNNGASPTFNCGTNGVMYCISVDDSNASLYKPGATEALNDGSDDFVCNSTRGAFYFAGMDFETDDNVINVQSNTVGMSLYMVDCILRPDTTGDYAIVAQDGAFVQLTNVDILANNTGAVVFSFGENAQLHWNGGSVSTATTLFADPGSPEGMTFNINGVGLSSVTTYIVGPADDRPTMFGVFRNCKLNASPTMLTSVHRGQYFEYYNCDEDTSDTYHRFYISGYAGTAQNNDTTYVTATESWYEGSDKSSIEVTTTANCSHGAPFIFELPAQYIDLSRPYNRKLAIDLVTDSTAVSLTDTDIAAFLCYPDGTTAVQANWITTGKTVGAGNYGVDPLATGTALANVGGLTADDWTSPPASANFYRMELNTGTDVGQATIVKVRIEVYKASIASGDLFINPTLTVY
jgi:hypothetical protein